MSKETKNTVSAETIVENLKEFATETHRNSKEAMLHFFLEKDFRKFDLANFIHNISHDLLDLLDGKSAKEILEHDDVEEDDEDEFLGTISVNVSNGEIKGIDDIKNPELKKRLASVVQELADKLGDK